MIFITDQNAFYLRVTAQTKAGSQMADVDLSVIKWLVAHFVRRGRSLQSMEIDSQGRAVIFNSGDLAMGVYGVELNGYYNGQPWRFFEKNVFAIVDQTVNAVEQSGEINGIPVFDVTLTITLGGEGVPESYVTHAINEHDNDMNAHPYLQERIENAGKVDDVKVNGLSVVDENKEANINITATIDGNVGVPEVDVEQEDGEIRFAFKNMKGEKGEKGAEGPVGPQGDSAVYNPDDPDAPDFEMANTTGQSTTKAMTQKAVTDAIDEGKIIKSSTETRSVQYYNGNSTVNWYVDASDGQFKTLSAGRSIELELTPDMKTIKYYASGFTSYPAGYAFVKNDGTYVSGARTTEAGNVTIDAVTPMSQGATKFRCCINTTGGSAISLTIYSETLEWPKRYTGTGSNEDGWMTQKAVTDALSNFDGAGIVGGSVALSKLASSAFDNTPTIGSNNLVRSKDIKEAIDAVSLDNFGKKASIVGLTNSSSTILGKANRIIKTVRKLTNYPAGYTDARLLQILATNVASHSWLIKFGYVVSGQTALQDVEEFGVNTLSKTIYKGSRNYTEIEVDWDEMASIAQETGSNNFEILFQPNVSSNYYRIHFTDEDRYIGGNIIGDGAITESKLSSAVQDKINGNINPLKGKHLVTLCDSLGMNGTWQTKLAELTGMVFSTNANNGKYSVGGTKTLTPNTTCGQGRALQLIADVENHLIDAPNIIIIENVNDGGGNAGNITDESFMLSERVVLDNTHKQTSRSNAVTYWQNNMAEILDSLTPKTGTILGIPYTTNTGIKLTITHAATTSGNYGVLCSGESGIKYITVAAGDSIETIVDKILEYNFDNHVAEKVGTDAIIFTRINSTEDDIAVYPNSTGITSTITRGMEGTQAYYLYFKGHDTANWNTAANWVESIPLYQAWKGMVEMLVNAFPKAMVYWFIPKAYQFNYNDAQYTRADGTPDWDAMLENEYQSNLFENQIRMAEYMNIPVLDIRQDSCINSGNISEYFNANNVHPKTAGYNRWGEALARLLL